MNDCLPAVVTLVVRNTVVPAPSVVRVPTATAPPKVVCPAAATVTSWPAPDRVEANATPPPAANRVFAPTVTASL